MKQDWHPDELAQHWTLSAEERELLDSKTSATRLSFAVLLKAFRFDGRFPERREDIAGRIVTYLASQTGVPPEAYSEGQWSERTQRYQRAQIRRHCGFRVFRIEDEPAFVAWLSERVTSPNPEAEALKIAAYELLGENSRKGNLRTFRCLDTASPSCDCEVHFKLTRLIAASLTCVVLEGD